MKWINLLMAIVVFFNVSVAVHAMTHDFAAPSSHQPYQVGAQKCAHSQSPTHSHTQTSDHCCCAGGAVLFISTNTTFHPIVFGTLFETPSDEGAASAYFSAMERPPLS